MTCKNPSCSNWIWADKLRPDTRCRKCGQWWQQPSSSGKGKGQGHGQAKAFGHGKTWPRKQASPQLLNTPPGLNRLWPLKQHKDQATAAELLASTWEVIPEPIQAKLTALGYGPLRQEEPELTELLKSHTTALPQEVQAVVTKLTQPHRERACSKAENSGWRFEVSVHQEEPTPDKVGSSQSTICFYAPGHARPTKQAE